MKIKLNSRFEQFMVYVIFSKVISLPGCQSHVGELCCVVSLDTPSIECRTGFLTPSPSPGAALHWTDDFTL